MWNCSVKNKRVGKKQNFKQKENVNETKKKKATRKQAISIVQQWNVYDVSICVTTKLHLPPIIAKILCLQLNVRRFKAIAFEGKERVQREENKKQISVKWPRNKWRESWNGAAKQGVLAAAIRVAAVAGCVLRMWEVCADVKKE